jgi:hypothetical protein
MTVLGSNLERQIKEAGAKYSAGDSLEIFDLSPRKIQVEYNLNAHK